MDKSDCLNKYMFMNLLANCTDLFEDLDLTALYSVIKKFWCFRHRSKGDNRPLQRSPSSDQEPPGGDSMEVVNEVKKVSAVLL